MAKLGLEKHIVDAEVYARTVARLKEAGVRMPTFAELAEPRRIPAEIIEALAGVDHLAPHPLNLYRVHWYNSEDGQGLTEVPRALELPKSLTGVDARIVVMLGDSFPMIHAHKVLAAYACLVPRLVTGQFDPTKDKAIWPSTGNYCRGGVAISRILDCHGVGILPEGMSEERFAWLRDWVLDMDTDIIATPGSESNVKEIYDKCNELDRDPINVIFNQFSEYGNHLAHYLCTGKALAHVYESLKVNTPTLRLRAYISATGSAGTIAAGDYLKDEYGCGTVALEAVECPTLLYNGFGEHNIQGIGDKHLPLIHNMMQTDAVAGISDLDTDTLFVLFNTEVGQAYLKDRRGVPSEIIDQLKHLGFSGIANILGAIKAAKYHQMGGDDLILTIATDGAEMYGTELRKALEKYWGGAFDQITAAEVFGRSVLGETIDHFMELTEQDKRRMFNLGYFTWVEQQGIDLKDFEARRHQAYWRSLRGHLAAWDEMIIAFNAESAK
ncbi:pyridoxal-5'-phosphate-dependent protein subunit beta [Myxococcota bacterium]|nr:pyridoxal-5'-phosphate-dependent protein subunit beta [Myxococcota bacterium]MBU1430214.1 pyridoxal-5'-phosphate-dependent protein subunit beta [Myxococcota bacterium]MBU1897515.1 pyridoxal-5'-phosphate-dependent protein subunit beta [Myxococcota bacterium]